ncbi:MAG TPA: AsmA family protein, partial [Acetobacteraceae bacterium]|nr:AsmA family protein [Acetobacteraceae bacterium]
MARARRRRFRLWPIVAVLVLAIVVGVGAVALLFDPNTLKPRIEAAAERATGRKLEIRGPITLLASLTPGFTANDIVFANAPGGSPEPMLAVARVEGRIDPMELLAGRLKVVSLTVVHPAILLEINAAGVPNWRFTPATPPTPPPASLAT